MGKDTPDVELSWPGKGRPLPAPAPKRRFVPAELYSAGTREARAPAAPEPSPPDTPPNRVYFGDNLQVLAALEAEMSGRIDLIYVDPPFCTGNLYPLRTLLSDESSRQDVHVSEAYSDRWEDGVAGYLSWLYPRLALMRVLLAPAGSLVVHLDWRVASHVRLVLDEIFGAHRLANELIWYKGFRGTRARGIFQHSHDILWWYVKGDGHYWGQTCEPYKDAELRRYNKVDEEGRRYARIKRRRTDGSIYYGKTYPGAGGKWRNDVIADIPTMAATSGERTGFATQKPVRLLEILVEALCPPGGLVADFFCGTGTTLRAAARLGRRFLGSDRSPVALHLTRRGLLAGRDPAPPFAVYRPEGELPRARRHRPPPVARRRNGTLTVVRGGSAGSLVDFWAVDGTPRGAAFRPQWYECMDARGSRTSVSPPFPGGRELRVLLSSRDGRELWVRV